MLPAYVHMKSWRAVTQVVVEWMHSHSPLSRVSYQLPALLGAQLRVEKKQLHIFFFQQKRVVLLFFLTNQPALLLRS